VGGEGHGHEQRESTPRQDGVRRFDGAEAVARLERFRGTDKEQALILAEEELRGRGFTKTNVITLLESVVIVGEQNQRSLPPGLALASTTISNSAGEVMISSWDDSDDSTWEGVIYAENYATGEWATFAGQIDISTAEYSANWGSQTGPLNQQGKWNRGEPGAERLSGFAFAVATERSKVVHAPSRGSGQIALTSGGFTLFRDFAWCAAGFCAICAEGCILSGPYWGICFTACCAASVIGCALAYLL
jgi:hypothetical protein